MIKLISEKIPSDNEMSPDEGGRYHKSLIGIEPFLYIPQGFSNWKTGRTYQAAFHVNILGTEKTFIDDEIFEDYSPAGKKAHKLVRDFIQKFKVVSELLIIPNIESLDGESE